MKFKFSLEVLLDHRQRLEDVAQRDWAEAQAKVDHAVAKLREFYGQIDDSRQRTAVLEAAGGAPIPELRTIADFISGQGYRIEMQRKIIRELTGEAERLQDILIEAAKETKTLKKLKERQLEQHKLHRRKAEAKELDDIVVTRFKRAE